MFFDATCAVCGTGSEPVCPGCEAGFAPVRPEPGAALRTRYVLDPNLREVVAALKYRRERRIASWAAARLEPLVPAAADVITWCPATPARVRLRGYDQARELAIALARRSGIPSQRLLRRSSGDDRQTGRTRHERARGPQLHPRRRPGELVVLVDDVTTTGATLEAARKVLLGAGARQVVAVTLAATPRRRS